MKFHTVLLRKMGRLIVCSDLQIYIRFFSNSIYIDEICCAINWFDLSNYSNWPKMLRFWLTNFLLMKYNTCTYKYWMNEELKITWYPFTEYPTKLQYFDLISNLCTTKIFFTKITHACIPNLNMVHYYLVTHARIPNQILFIKTRVTQTWIPNMNIFIHKKIFRAETLL